MSTETIFVALWIAGGVISLVGALCYAELGSAYPSRAANTTSSRVRTEALAFLFAWARMTVVQTGAIAASRSSSATTQRSFFRSARKAPWFTPDRRRRDDGVNIAGTRESKPSRMSSPRPALAMAAVILARLLRAGASTRGGSGCRIVGARSSHQLALIFVLLTYGGWNEAAYITAEVRTPRRNIVRALVIGILIVTVLYVLLNVAYVNVLGLEGMKASKALAAD